MNRSESRSRAFLVAETTLVKLQKSKSKQSSWRITLELFREGLKVVKGNKVEHIVWKFGQSLIIWHNAKRKAKLCVPWMNSQVTLDAVFWVPVAWMKPWLLKFCS